jgi:hypothetical protein
VITSAVGERKWETRGSGRRALLRSKHPRENLKAVRELACGHLEEKDSRKRQQ